MRIAPRLFALIAAALVPAFSSTVQAGGGPENVLLVVNPQSNASLTIANHYARLRGIPTANVLYLPWSPKAELTDVETFRREILRPVIKAAEARDAATRIDYVVYSSDFPWGVGLDEDVKALLARAESGQAPLDRRALLGRVADEDSQDGEHHRHDSGSRPPDDPWPRILTKRGSINGLTYLWQQVLEGDARYLGLDTNGYMPRAAPGQEEPASRAFSSCDRFPTDGQIVAKGGRSYLLSMMLGVTAGRGNTVDEVLAYLGRSTAADGTHPAGTIYYVRNSNIRSKTRDEAFPAACDELKALGVKAEIVEGIVPRDKPDVQGAMLGTATFDWKASGSTILPGAICEHLTSSGGVMRSGAGQTPLSELLRYGATAASGTVIEPYALQAKFPTPALHVHYARGCTAAEAFYQSLAGPYQLLIVGDPLCRPWADIPDVRVEGVEPDATIKGPITLRPTATVSSGGGIERFELFVDGSRQAECPPGGVLTLDTATLADGYRELRVVAVAGGPIRSQGHWIAAVTTANHGRTIEAAATPPGRVVAGTPLAIDVKSPGSRGVEVLHDTQAVGRIDGDEGRIEIDSSRLGEGPVRLRVVGLGDGPLGDIAAAPVELTIEAKEPAE